MTHADILLDFIFDQCDVKTTPSVGPYKLGGTCSFFVKSDISIKLINIGGNFNIYIDDEDKTCPQFSLYICPIKLKSAIIKLKQSNKKSKLIEAFNKIVDTTFENLANVLSDTIKRNFYINDGKFKSVHVEFWSDGLCIDESVDPLPWISDNNFAEEFDMYNELHQRIYEIDQWIVAHTKGET